MYLWDGIGEKYSIYVENPNFSDTKAKLRFHRLTLVCILHPDCPDMIYAGRFPLHHIHIKIRFFSVEMQMKIRWEETLITLQGEPR